MLASCRFLVYARTQKPAKQEGAASSRVCVRSREYWYSFPMQRNLRPSFCANAGTDRSTSTHLKRWTEQSTWPCSSVVSPLRRLDISMFVFLTASWTSLPLLQSPLFPPNTPSLHINWRFCGVLATRAQFRNENDNPRCALMPWC